MAATQPQPRRRNDLGGVGDQVRRNVKALREARNMSTTTLAQRLTELGRPILPTGITKIEGGDRRVDVGDLVALAAALGVNPNRLLMPERADDTPTELTPTVIVPAGIAWYWANGSLPVMGFYADERAPDERAMDFRREVRPIEHQVNAEQPAHRAALQIKTRIDQLLDAERHGASPERISDMATNLRRSLQRLVAEVRDLLADFKPHEPAVLVIVRDDGLTGEESGVHFTDGVATLRENDARAELFTGPGFTVNRMPMEPHAAAAASRTFGDLLSGAHAGGDGDR